MDENVFLLHSFLLGVGITFLYDILRILRRVFAHSTSMVSLEDLAFWIYCAGKVFLLMFHESNGNLRWFAVLGGIGGNVPVSQDNQSLFCKVCGTGPEYSSAPNPESLADNGKLAEKAVDYT